MGIKINPDEAKIIMKPNGQSLSAVARAISENPRTILQAAQPRQWTSLSKKKAMKLAKFWGITIKHRVFYEIWYP